MLCSTYYPLGSCCIKLKTPSENIGDNDVLILMVYFIVISSSSSYFLILFYYYINTFNDTAIRFNCKIYKIECEHANIGLFRPGGLDLVHYLYYFPVFVILKVLTSIRLIMEIFMRYNISATLNNINVLENIPF